MQGSCSSPSNQGLSGNIVNQPEAQDRRHVSIIPKASIPLEDNPFPLAPRFIDSLKVSVRVLTPPEFPG